MRYYKKYVYRYALYVINNLVVSQGDRQRDRGTEGQRDRGTERQTSRRRYISLAKLAEGTNVAHVNMKLNCTYRHRHGHESLINCISTHSCTHFSYSHSYVSHVDSANYVKRVYSPGWQRVCKVSITFA